MSAKKIAEVMAEQISRRTFLVRMTSFGTDDERRVRVGVGAGGTQYPLSKG